MPRPTKRDGSANEYFIKRVPADLAEKLKGKRVNLNLPPASIGEPSIPVAVTVGNVVKLSLLTADPSLTRMRHAAIAAQIEAVFKAERAESIPLTQKQIVAFAGVIYQNLVSVRTNEPGSVTIWAHVLRLHREAREAGKLEQWIGPLIDDALLREGLRTDAMSRGRLIEEVDKALVQASRLLKRHAEGDYRPDADAERFPQWTPPAASPPASKPLQAAATGGASGTLTGLVEAWWIEAQATGRKPSTYESYRNTMSRFAKLMGHDDARRVSPEDVIRFKDARLAEVNPRTGTPISPKTIKSSDLNGLKVVFDWAVTNRKLPSNPAADVTLKLGKQPKRTRPKGFTDAEAKVILTHAFNYLRGQDQAHTAAAKRWVPWLCAYTGARVGEIAQLRKQDVRYEDGLWIITITPEAGTVKTNAYREVPLHDHLIELGFTAFVASSREGPLFIKPAKDGSVAGPAKGLTNRLAEFVREVFDDKRVAPNHGWRHRFKTVAREMRIDQEVRNEIQGHDTKDVAAEYGDVTLKTKADAIAKLPRYTIDDHSTTAK